MVWHLTEEEVVKHWDLIKYGAFQVNRPQDQDKYFIGLLKELLSGKAQAWFVADASRKIKAMALTKITRNIAGESNLLVDTLYGYSQMSLQEQEEGMLTVVKFARNVGVSSIFAHVSASEVGSLAQRAGMVKATEVYKMNIERIK
jgi:hypothetical protein